jgi:hypothetical protein
MTDERMTEDERDAAREAQDRAAELTPPQAELARYMSQLSEELYCASWIMGNEFELWHAVLGTRHLVSEEQRAELARLSKACDGWIVWREEGGHGGGEAWVSLEDWRQIFDLREQPPPLDGSFPETDPPLVDESDVVDLLRAALGWRSQGAKTKWTTGPSTLLAETVDRIRGRYPALCSTLAVPRACGAPHPVEPAVKCARPAEHAGAHQTDEAVSPEEWQELTIEQARSLGLEPDDG